MGERKPEIMAVDVGYSACKVATPQKLFSFPSVVAIKPETGMLGKKLETFSYKGQEYLVGKEALNFPHYIVGGKEEDASIVYGALYLAKAFKEAGTKPDVVAVSIAVHEYKKPMEVYLPDGRTVRGMKNEILEQVLSEFEVNGQVYKQNVVVLPQGRGIYLDVGSPDEAIIVDVGFKTIDILLFRNGEIVYTKGLSNQGVITIADLIANAIREKTGLEVSLEEAEQFLRSGKVKVYGEEKELKEFVNFDALKFQFVKRIFGILESDPNLSPVLRYLGKIIIAGGGGYFVPDRYKNYKVVVPEKPEYSNVRGFLRLLEEV